MKKFIAGFIAAIAVMFAIPYVIGFIQNVGLIEKHIEISFELYEDSFDLDEAFDIYDYVK